ncbi:hypothetical protein A2716_02430 [candidate division WWE3 bacterium RIFCSPHIGHO2_01_FULL_40_23]|nr:MAG: hypothetical protein A2716_02430 [candidate division WWE3 bacterium RIFCSPHIGHO2_01_FULL_40_23]
MRRILIVLIPVIIIVTLFLYRQKLIKGFGIKLLPVKEVNKTEVDKSDPNWLENYCLKEVKNLPEAPFAFTVKDVHPRSRNSISDVYLHKYIPDEKWYKGQTCAIWYTFKPEDAYASVGVEYIFHIDYVNAFEENTDTLYTKAIDGSWKKISPLSDSEGGRPHYSYDGFPLVFTRENQELGTVEYATVSFGSRSLYIHFLVYEK